MAERRSTVATVDDTRAQVVRWLAVVTAAILTIFGVVGFFVTGFNDFAEPTGEELLGFGTNPLYNLVNLAVGIAGLVMAWQLRGARAYGWILTVVYGILLVWGLVVDYEADGNIFNLNTADLWAHVFVVIAGLVIALLPARSTYAAQR